MKRFRIQKINRVCTRLVLSVAVCLGVFCFGALEAYADVYYVKYDAGGSNNGSSWTNAFTLLESALDAASDGDEIWVAAGTYYPTDDYDEDNDLGDRFNHFEMKNGVGIYGGFAGTETLRTQRDWETNETILSGDIGTPGDATDNCYHVFYNYSIDSTGVLDGFTITGGYADGDAHGSEYLRGGGIHNTYCTATISNCVIKGNHAATSDAEGGGMYNYDDGPIITNCVFEGNSSDYYGGGMCNSGSNPTVTGCRFENNSAKTDGGGMLCWEESHPIIINCEFIGNSTGVDGYSGCMYIYDGSDAQITNCKFIGNHAGGDGDGGGILLDGVTSDTVVTNCLFIGNSARNGGGMDIGDGNAQLINCTFSGNSANYGGGIHFFYSDATIIKNTIVWGNSATVEGNEINIAAYNPSNPIFSYCDIAGSGGSGAGWNAAMGIDGGGNIDEDPLFADAANGALQLLSGSPCINTGDTTAVPAGITTDLDGNARIVDGTVDMGAYEYFRAAPAASIPTLTEWGILILFSGLGIGAGWTLRKNRFQNAAM